MDASAVVGERTGLQPEDIAPVFFATWPDDVDTRCVQACYRMLVARSSGSIISTASADAQTDFAEGRLTWQFAMLLSLAEEYALHVVDFERFDYELFVRDPRAAIEAQIQDVAAVDYQMENSDIELEVDRARRCLNHPKISLVNQTPSYEDLQRVVRGGATVTCVINGGPLLGDDVYRPHSIVVRAANSDATIIDDPGPPPRPHWPLTRREFERYWLDPSPSVANFIAVSAGPFNWRG